MEYPWISTAMLALMMVIECVCCMKTFIPRATKLQKFRKITVDSTGRNIFVGGKNSLYHLDANLNEIGLHGVSTGPQKDSKICIREEMETNPDMCDIQLSDDYPQVLQVYRNLLVTCGTVSLGECVGRDLQDISVVNITSSTHFVVNTEKLGTTESVIAEIGTESVLFVAKSHVRSKKNFDANSEVRLIIYAGQLNLIENSFLQPYEYQRNRIFSIQTVNTFEDHSFDFDIKAMLYMKNSKSVYSLLRITNLHQKPLETVSKVSKICAKETAFNSYEDIPIKCADFPHVQDGFAIQYGQSEVLVALFSSAEIVSKTTAGAVCVFTEKELLEGFRKSRIKQCSSPEVYLDPSTTNSCIKPDMPLYTAFNKTDFCNENDKFENIIGSVTLEKSPVFNGTGLTSVGGSFRNNLTTILVGSHTGVLQEFYLNKSDVTNIRELKPNHIQDNQWPIIDIVTTPLHSTVLLTTYSVVLLEDEGSCPGETCTECMTNANSKCGWCIMESRCKEKTSCKEENFWLPSVEGACLTVHTNAAGASQINQILKVDVFLNPPVPITGNDWYCEYGKSCKGDGDPCKSKLTINDSGMSCEIEHKDAFLEEEIYRAPFSIGRNGSILVGGWEFLFYTCSGFKTCLDCVNNPKVNKCSWNIQMATCTERVNEPAYVNTDDVSRCPQISKMDLKLPYDRQKNVLIKAKNLPSLSPSDYNCSVSGQVFSVLEVNVTTILCGVKIKTDSPFSVTYKESRIDNPGKDIATVYRCDQLTQGCSQCIYLKSQGYLCGWDTFRRQCSYNTAKEVDSTSCPSPHITISPLNGTVFGNTSLHIHGTELGSNIQDVGINVSGNVCDIYAYNFFPNQWIKCYTRNEPRETRGGEVILTRNGKLSENKQLIDYFVPELFTINPLVGIMAGGRILTIKGKNLLISNRDRINVLLYNQEEAFSCIIGDALIQRNNSEIVCMLGAYRGTKLPYHLTSVSVTYDDAKYNITGNMVFTFVDNPIINIGRTQAFMGGGVDMNITGERFTAVSIPRIGQDPCTVINDSSMKCNVPQYNPSRRRKRRQADTCPCYQHYTIHMDNFEVPFSILFTENPTILPFEDTVTYTAGSYVTIQGKDLLRGAVESDYEVLVQTTRCDEVSININGTLITFKPPDFLHEGNEYQVEVLVGNLRQNVGAIYYEKDLTIIIICAVLGAVVLSMLVVLTFCMVRVRKKNSQVSKLQNDIVEMESNIRSKSREVFADMQMSMQDIKGDLVTTGIPYFNYHHYSFHALFPKLKAGESIYYQSSAMTDITPKCQMEDISMLAPKGILAFEELLKNKFFLQSLIRTMERQNNFSVQEKAEFSSLLTVILLGKMTYISQVIEELLHKLIAGASRKQYKVLFRRSDSITQKLLSDWMSLSLFPYLKGGGGQQLFMLYKAAQTVMEKGPIDAVTLESKETLAEERLLKMDLSYESLTLEVDLNGKKSHRYQVTVLDCDTITQVKAKCMYRIYKNKPASELQFTPEELILEWHAGKGGKLVLNDIDRTSMKREGYVCHNTLRHYNVKDGSCMALLISDDPEDPDVYMNSESVSMNDMLLSDQSVTSYKSWTAEKQWHISFPEEDEKEGRGTHIHIEELYLNRLIQTKLKLADYINAIFENVLDDNRVPPVICYFFKMLEEMAKEHGVDPDIVTHWKSECYAMRIWSLWISRPDLLFDIVLAKHVIPCLDVVRSVFSDVFSQTSSRLTKDSSSAKLLFANDVPKFQEKMRKFYEKLSVSCEPVTKQQFDSLMQSISQEQTQGIRVKKLPALKKLFSMVKKYSDEIISDLDEERETKDLELGEKFDSVIQQMDMV